MAEAIMTKVWAIEFQHHRWMVQTPTGAEERKFTSPNVKYVALAIARASLWGGACWASQKTLGDVTGVSKQTIQRCIAELEDCGWLRRIPRNRTNGSKTTDMIWLTMPEVVLAAETVPPRPKQWLPGGENADDHEGPPTTTVVPAPASQGAKVIGQAPPTAGEAGDSVGGPEGSPEGILGREDSHVRTADVNTAVEQIWARASKMGRQRSSKVDIARALGAALERGHQMETVLRGLGGYFASKDATKEDGAYQRGAHVMLSADRFMSFLDEGTAIAAATPAEAKAADQAVSQTGTMERPSETLQRAWMDLWSHGMPWNPERGPQPGRVGCRVSPEIQREFDVDPYDGQGPPDDDNTAAFD